MPVIEDLVPDVDAGPQPIRWLVTEFHRMKELGFFRDRSTMLIVGQLLEQNHGDPKDPDPRPVLFTRDEFNRLGEYGFFKSRRVMLIDGEVLAMSPMNPDHANGILFTVEALRKALGSNHTYRTQLPMDFGLLTDPEPDVAVIAGPHTQNLGTPTSAELVVEVADSSLQFDTTEKASLYAAGGIADYWVLDVVNYQLFVFRDPRPNSGQKHGFAYQTRLTFRPGQSVTPLVAPNSPVALADMLP